MIIILNRARSFLKKIPEYIRFHCVKQGLFKANFWNYLKTSVVYYYIRVFQYAIFPGFKYIWQYNFQRRCGFMPVWVDEPVPMQWISLHKVLKFGPGR